MKGISIQRSDKGVITVKQVDEVVLGNPKNVIEYCKRCGEKPVKSKGFCATCYNIHLRKVNKGYDKTQKEYQKKYQKNLREEKKKDKKWIKDRAKEQREYRKKHPQRFYTSLAKSAIKHLDEAHRKELIKILRSM